MHTKNKLHSGKHEVNEARWQKQSWPHLMTKKGNEQTQCGLSKCDGEEAPSLSQESVVQFSRGENYGKTPLPAFRSENVFFVTARPV